MQRTIVQRFAAFVIGAALSLLAMELAVRQLFLSVNSIEPGYGFIIEPGSTCRWRLEGNGLGHWTENGVRGRVPPDLNRPSILAIGDSQTEARQVDDDEVYTAQLQRLLAGRHTDLQVLNAGRSSQSVADLIFFAPRYQRLFHPRWTIVEVGEGDITDGAWRADRSHFVKNGDQLSVTAPPEVQPMALAQRLGPAVTSFVRHCMLIQYGTERLRRIQAEADPPWFRAGAVPEPGPPPAIYDPQSYPVEDELKLLMSAYEQRVTILYLAEFDPQNPGTPKPTEARLRQWCTANGWSCVTSRRYYPTVAAQHKAPYGFPNSTFNEGHLNELGHRLLAQALEEELRKLAERGLL